MDRITIEGLRVETHVGATDDERAVPQVVFVDVELGADLEAAGLSDELEDTVDYAEVTALVARLVAGKSVKLLEHLAHEVAGAVLAIKGVQTVSVQIAKEKPPVGENVRNIAVRIERSRS